MFIDSIHNDILLGKGDFFLKSGTRCTRIGMLVKGVLRGFVEDNNGNEVTTHFFKEGDMVIGSSVPDTNTLMTFQALEECCLSVANHKVVMSYLNRNQIVTGVIYRAFQKTQEQVQSRLIALLNMDSVEKYELFLQEYPGLINRIPHYYIANFLGITATQLSRARSRFINKCK